MTLIIYQADRGFNDLCQKYLGASLEDLVKSNVDSATTYRSYVNSLHLQVEGRHRFLVPQFPAIKGVDGESLADIEERVAAAYQQASPGSEVVWIEGSAISERQGAIHCLTLAVPR